MKNTINNILIRNNKKTKFKKIIYKLRKSRILFDLLKSTITSGELSFRFESKFR